MKIDFNQPPHDDYWQRLSNQIQQLPQMTKEIHQLRYQISKRQAQWVRDHYPGETDQEKFLAYLSILSAKDYSLSESERLHQKLCLSDGTYPAGYDIANFKVSIHFHSEFVLDAKGNFLVIDKKSSENGILNGASFNFANQNDQEHRRLDIDPVLVYDPNWRNTGKHFVNPSMTEYKSSSSAWAIQGKSAFKRAQTLKKHFAKNLSTFPENNETSRQIALGFVLLLVCLLIYYIFLDLNK